MVNPNVLNELKKALQKDGMFDEPSALDTALSYLQSAPDVAANVLVYLGAKQELKEMKTELARMQNCVRELEKTLEEYGPGVCGHSAQNLTFVNWMVSFAESYYSLAAILNVKERMLPRVLMYLNGHVHNLPWLKQIDQAAFGDSRPIGARLPKGWLDKFGKTAKQQPRMPGFLRG